MTTLTYECPECDGEGRATRSKWGGNDPNTWTVPCEACDRTGRRTRYCEGLFCTARATELVTFPDGASEPFCARCARTAREDAGMEAEPARVW